MKKGIFSFLCLGFGFVLVGCSNDGEKYSCTYNEELVGMNGEVKINIFHQDDDINKIEITKTYTIEDEEEQDNLATYRWIIDTENEGYAKKSGINIRIHEDNTEKYSFTYVLNMNNLEEDMYEIFDVSKSFETQKTKLQNKKDLVCE